MASPDINIYRTPTKGIINNFNSNSYLAYSTLYGSNQFNSSKYNWTNQKYHFHSTGFPAQQSRINENSCSAESSSIVLQPALTQEDIISFLETKKMILFLSNQENRDKLYLSRRQKLIHQIHQKKAFLQNKIYQQKLKYQKKKKQLASVKKRKQLNRRKRNSVLQKQMQMMELQIIKMRWSQSKSKYQSPQKNVKKYKDQQYPINYQLYAAEKHKTKGNLLTNPYYYENGFNPQVCKSMAQNPKKQENMRQKNNNRKDYNQQPYREFINPQQTNNNYLKKQNNSSNYQKNSFSNYSNTASFNSYYNPLNIIAEKLRTQKDIPFLVKNTTINKKESQSLEGLISERDVEQVQIHQELPVVKTDYKKKESEKNFNYTTGLHNSQKFQIHVNNITKNLVDKVIPNDPRDSHDDLIDFDYLNQNSHEIKNNIVISNHNINAEDNEQELEMLNILENSVRLSQRKKASQIVKNSEKQKQLLKPEIRSAIGAKLIETNLGHHEYLDVPEKTKMQISNVDISYDSEQMKFNKSSDSGSGHSTILKKQEVKKNSIKVSNINILIEQSGHSPKNITQLSPIVAKKQSGLREKIESLDMKMSNIEQLDEEYLSRKDTPVNMQDQFQFDITQSKLVVSQKSNNFDKITNSNNGKFQESNSTQKTLPLAKPPSLTEIQEEEELKRLKQQNEEDDFGLDQIQLSVQSRIQKPENSSQNYLRSQLTQKSQVNQDLDDIFSIKLATESRISRQNKSRVKENPIQDIQLSNKQQRIIRQSDGKLHSRGSLQIQAENSQFQEAIRNSARSSIIRKGSAIQKIKNRENVNNIRMSNYQSSSHLGKSNQIFSLAIQEAEEQQQDGPPSSQRKHKKNVQSTYNLNQ